MRGRDGYDFYGNRLRVELAKGAGGRGRGFGGGPPPGFRPRQTGFRVLVKGLPISASWQDLKVGKQHEMPKPFTLDILIPCILDLWLLASLPS